MNQYPFPSDAPPVQSHVRCPNCGYDLTGAAIGSACPECGLIIGRGTFAAGSSLPMSGKAIASLVLGILSIVGCSTYGILSIPCGIVAIILARGVNTQIMNEEVSPASAGMAKAGLICGIVGLSLGGAMFLFIFGFLFLGLMMTP